MYRTAVGQEKRTLFVTLLAKTQQRSGSAQVTPGEFSARYFEVISQSADVFASNVDEAFRLATSHAAGLTLKAHAKVYPENCSRFFYGESEVYSLESKQSRIRIHIQWKEQSLGKSSHHAGTPA